MHHPFSQLETFPLMPDDSGDGALFGEVPDSEIVQRVIQGDIAAFELVMRRYNQRLYRVARGIVGENAAAEDVVQETYLRAFKNLTSFEGRSSFATWITKIAVYEALACRRKVRRARALAIRKFGNGQEPVVGKPNRPEEIASNRELNHMLVRAIDALPPILRDVFTLRVVDGLSTQETALYLDLTEAVVKVRLHRARGQLQKQIARQAEYEIHNLYLFNGIQCDCIVKITLARIAFYRQFLG